QFRLETRASAAANTAGRRYQAGSEQLGQDQPASDGIPVMTGEKDLLGLTLRMADRDGRRKSAIDRQDRAFADARKDKAVPVLDDMDDAIGDLCPRRRLGFEIIAIRSDQAEGERYMHRLLDALSRGGRHGLLDLDDELACGRIMSGGNGKMRRPGLMIPQ